MDKPVTPSATRSSTDRAISPLRLFVILLAVLFVDEALIMFLLPLLFPAPETTTTLVNFADSLLLITLAAPFIWSLIVQPLRKAVKTEAAWAAALLEHVVDGVVVFDGHGIVRSLNPAAELIFRYCSREMTGQHVNCLLSRQGVVGENSFLLHGTFDAPHEGQRISHDILGLRKNGTSFPMDFSVSELYLAGETAFIGIVRETTERKEIEAAMFEKQCQLAELNLSLEERVAAAVGELREKDRILIQQSRQAAMGEMINNIAHQWRQPLNVLGLSIQQLRIVYNAGSLSKEYLETCVNKSMGMINFMSQTINDFSNFIKPDTEKVEFSIHEVVARTVALVEDGFKNQQIGIDIQASANPTITGFPNEYSQALLNILMNARDALSERRPVDAKVTVIISKAEERGVVTISDNAGGIPEEIISKIFEPYFTTRGPDRGTGLGLYLSKTIIEKNMNGRLTARNAGEGAEFRIEV
jgi:PAS domain S-box-containing protein